MFGEEAKLKKQLAEEQKKKEEDMLRREKMFLQVIEIDPEDSIALYGMADIFFYRKDFKNASENLKKVLSVNPKYSTAYLLLGKAYEAMNETALARQIYQDGIQVASKQGDMMPANEMQSRLNQLVVVSGLS
jgi:Tfp pilus assembly protein PilF